MILVRVYRHHSEFLSADWLPPRTKRHTANKRHCRVFRPYSSSDRKSSLDERVAHRTYRWADRRYFLLTNNKSRLRNKPPNTRISPNMQPNAPRQAASNKAQSLHYTKRCLKASRTTVFSRLPHNLRVRITVGEIGLLLHMRYI